MEIYPILVDGEEIDTGNYSIFPDMNRVIADPGLAIALQLREASLVQRFVFSSVPQLITSKLAEMRYLRDFRKYHGVPKYTNDELDEVIYAKISIAGESDIERAIVAGVRDHKKLFNPFRHPNMGLTLEERADAIYEAGESLRKRWDDLSRISVKEGMPIKTLKWAWELKAWQDYRTSVDEWGQLLDIIEKPAMDGGNNYRFREPYGVTALFPPYNAPIALGIFSITSSLLAGNASILKPPSKVPLSIIFFAQVYLQKFLEMDLPPTLIQVITGGGKQLMKRFMSDSHVKAIAWYGDSETGIDLWARAIKKRIQMAPELAGSDAFLVWGSDVDLEHAAELIVNGRYLGSGQACMAVKRLLVQDSLHDDLVKIIVEKVEKLKIGLPSDPEVTLPPVGLTALYQLLEQIDDALSKGAKIETGGYRCNYLEEPDPAGLFYKPTILTGVRRDMKIMQEEVFAPALPVLPINDLEEALEIANDSRFGLRSSVFSNDIDVRRKWVKEIQAAGVGLGVDHVYYDPYMPHLGGYKDSGIIGGKYFTEMLSRMKYVHTSSDYGVA